MRVIGVKSILDRKIAAGRGIQRLVPLVACNSQFESALRARPAGCGVACLANMLWLFGAARFVHPARPDAPFPSESTVTGH